MNMTLSPNDANEPEAIVRVIYSDLESPSSPCPQTEYDVDVSPSLPESSPSEQPHELASSDTIVNSVMTKFASRSRLGVEKYGTTLDRTDVSTVEWVNHLQEELMDAILYIERLKRDLIMAKERAKERAISQES